MYFQMKKFGTGFNSDSYKQGYDQIDWSNSEEKPTEDPAQSTGTDAQKSG